MEPEKLTRKEMGEGESAGKGKKGKGENGKQNEGAARRAERKNQLGRTISATI